MLPGIKEFENSIKKFSNLCEMASTAAEVVLAILVCMEFIVPVVHNPICRAPFGLKKFLNSHRFEFRMSRKKSAIYYCGTVRNELMKWSSKIIMERGS